MIRVRRIGASVVTALVLSVVGAGPASAHTVSGQGSTNFQTRLISVAPQTPGLRVRSVELGSLIELTWTGSDDLIVLGYSGEPYLRLGPEGVFRNRLSPATYLNQTRYGGVQIPSDASADPKTAPEWHKISGGPTVTWHDHRTHFMGGLLPPVVRQSPGTFHTVFPWTIDIEHGSRMITVSGALVWVPGPSSSPWWLLILVLAGIGVAAGLTAYWWRALLAFTTVIVVADIVHAVGTGLEFVGSATHRLLLIIGGSYYSIVAWILGAIAIRFLARRSLDGLFAAVFTGLVIGIFGGLADVASLWHSQVPFRFGAAFARVLIALSIGGSAGLIGGAILAFRRNREPIEAPASAPGGGAPLVDPSAAA